VTNGEIAGREIVEEKEDGNCSNREDGRQDRTGTGGIIILAQLEATIILGRVETGDGEDDFLPSLEVNVSSIPFFPLNFLSQLQFESPVCLPKLEFNAQLIRNKVKEKKKTVWE
jgi:hypothetical protein